MRSNALNINESLAKLLESHGIITATPIQEKIIPAIKEGKDILAQSETGSGKTLSFAIPLIEMQNSYKDLFALILVPTRELCNQIHKEFVKFSPKKHNTITAVYGGVSINEQIRKIKHTGTIVATPGRLVDLINRRAVDLKKIKYLVLDEADRMLDMGFITDIEFILKAMPVKPQTMLFSATISDEIKKLSRKFLHEPFSLKLKTEIKPEFLNQTYYRTSCDKKLQLLIHLLKSERDLTIVFCNTKRMADKLSHSLKDIGLRTKALHGNLTQIQRERVTSDFRQKRFNILIATDVAARGLHIDDITHVYNYDIPKDVDSYTHRVGRTARAGNKGEAISIVCSNDDQRFFKQILFNYNGVILLKKAGLPFFEVLEDDNKSRRNFTKGHEKRGSRKVKENETENRSSSFSKKQDRYFKGSGKSNRRKKSHGWSNY